MAATYIPIASTTLTTSAASVTFSAIPQTYTDLVLRVSIRTNAAAAFTNAALSFNGLSTNIHSETFLTGNGSSASSFRATSLSAIDVRVNGNGSTSNTFSNNEFYIANYTGTTNKPISLFNTTESNATAADLSVLAILSQLTTGITSITISASTMQSGSTFHLYGIKNS